MRKLLICIAAAGSTLVVASPAAAQYYSLPYSYNGYGYVGPAYDTYGNGGYGYGYGYGYGGYGMGTGVQNLCSGQRGFALESRIRREEAEGEIDPYTAGRIHQAIDRLEDQQRHECAEGDWRSIALIGSRYDRIDEWIETAAHGYRAWDR